MAVQGCECIVSVVHTIELVQMDPHQRRVIGVVLLFIMALLIQTMDESRRAWDLPPLPIEWETWRVFHDLAVNIFADVDYGRGEQDSGSTMVLQQFRICAAAAKEVSVRRRGLWYVKPRQVTWWEDFVQREWTANRWKKNFRLSKELFQELVGELQPLIEGPGCNWHAALPAHVKVAAF